MLEQICHKGPIGLFEIRRSDIHRSAASLFTGAFDLSTLGQLAGEAAVSTPGRRPVPLQPVIVERVRTVQQRG